LVTLFSTFVWGYRVRSFGGSCLTPLSWQRRLALPSSFVLAWVWHW